MRPTARSNLLVNIFLKKYNAIALKPGSAETYPVLKDQGMSGTKSL
ncbi:MAG: hypothetical protein ACTSWN_12095 [Promethearchaeota archaeon]